MFGNPPGRWKWILYPTKTGKKRPEFLSVRISSSPDVQTLPRSIRFISYIHLVNSAGDGGFQSRCCIQKNEGSIFFFPPEFDWFWKSCKGAQLVSSRLSDLAPTAALGSILRFKLKRGGLRCYGYSVFTLTALTTPSTNGSIVVVESLSRIGETQKPFSAPSISASCLWNTFDRENILLHLLPSVAGIHLFSFFHAVFARWKTLVLLPPAGRLQPRRRHTSRARAAFSQTVSPASSAPRMTRSGRSLLCHIATEARF